MKIMRWGLTASSLLLLAAATATAEQQAPTDADAQAQAEADALAAQQKQREQDEQLHAQVHALAEDGLFVETFDAVEALSGSRWFQSTHEKYVSQSVALDEYTVRSGHVTDKGLVLQAAAKHYGLGVKLDKPLLIDGSEQRKEMVVQYEVKLQKGLSCGGAYLKLLRDDVSNEYASFSDATPFVVMFGPDKCGANDKVHFIFQHKNPLTGEYEEKHLQSPPKTKGDRLTHLYTLVVRDDNTYEMLIDQESVSSGSLLEAFAPPVLPPKEIEDETDSKPSDWVDEAEIRDPEATKPEDWDEDAPAVIPNEAATKPTDWLDDEEPMIDDPSVAKPEDWDDEDDGDWVAPQVPNPKCEAVSGCGTWTQPTKPNPAFKGKWQAPLIPNPAYKGEWKPRLVPNPAFFEDEHPARLAPIGAVAVEVWTMSEGITFDNFWLGNDAKQAAEFAALTFAPKHQREVEEQEQEREKERLAAEERRALESSYTHQIKTLVSNFSVFTQENPVAGVGLMVIAGLVVTLIAFFACCSKPAATDADKKAKKEESGSEGEQKGKDSGAEDSDASGKRKLRQRKKAPVVKDD